MRRPVPQNAQVPCLPVAICQEEQEVRAGGPDGSLAQEGHRALHAQAPSEETPSG